jgi:hypothetical protein
MVPQSGKDRFYCYVYYIILNSNHEDFRVTKILRKKRKKELEAKINPWVIVVHF